MKQSVPTRSGLRSAAALVTLAAVGVHCAAPSRFALRQPRLRDADNQPFAQRPAEFESSNSGWAADQTFLRPVSRAFAFPHVGEARNVNALDEVPDSTWFTNRAVTPAEAGEGACHGVAPPQAPLTIFAVKATGATPGFFVRDATGRRFAIKLDQRPDRAPELTTASDAIVSRLYWSIGYNTPCNNVTAVRVSDFVVRPGVMYRDPMARRHELVAADVPRFLARGVQRPDGSTRVGASLFIEGGNLGQWRAVGTRGDDPNDIVPHEHRRELRGERLLAAWVNHWDAREPNSYDAWVTAPGGGYVRHYMFDFGDSLGAMTTLAEHGMRLGQTHYLHFGEVLEDFVGLGINRRPWDDARINQRAPTLAYFESQYFDPSAWQPIFPMVRFDNAREEDIGWMARRIARISREHLREMIAAGRFTDTAVSEEALSIVMARRHRALEWAFSNSSPLGDLTVVGGDRACATDLAVVGSVAPAATTRYRFGLRRGEQLDEHQGVLRAEHGTAFGQVCVRLPHFAPASAPDDAAERYAVVEMERLYAGSRTRLRAHFYDLGPERGYVLVGVER